jgi:hypothetical protein
LDVLTGAGRDIVDKLNTAAGEDFVESIVHAVKSMMNLQLPLQIVDTALLSWVRGFGNNSVMWPVGWQVVWSKAHKATEFSVKIFAQDTRGRPLV